MQQQQRPERTQASAGRTRQLGELNAVTVIVSRTASTACCPRRRWRVPAGITPRSVATGAKLRQQIDAEHVLPAARNAISASQNASVRAENRFRLWYSPAEREQR